MSFDDLRVLLFNQLHSPVCIAGQFAQVIDLEFAPSEYDKCGYQLWFFASYADRERES